MVPLTALTILIALVAVGNADPLIRVHFSGRDQAIEFREFAEEKNLDIWKIDASSANVRIPAERLEEIRAKYPVEVLHNDIIRYANESMLENMKAEFNAKRFRNSDHINAYYHSFDQIMQWLGELERSNDNVQVRSVGLSYEKREMKVIRIAGDDSKEGSMPAVFLTGGIHAREWLSTATLNYMIDQIIKLRNNGDPRITNLLKKYDFYFMPVTNPDGYAYTFNGGIARMWRKTRRPIPGSSCIGTDPNRNFDVEFGKHHRNGYPCSEVYEGPYPFSEHNTRSLRDFGKSFNGRLLLYYDVHAYGQMYFVPFAYNNSIKPDNDAELRRVGLLSRAAIERVNNRTFKFGTPGDIFYAAPGSTMDWFLLGARTKYAYALEIYPVWGNIQIRNGFLEPPSAIIPSGKEILEGLLTAAENVRAE